MSTAAVLRAPMLPLSRRLRAYFAPVARASETPTIFDPAANVAFDLDVPPAPWVDGGWIENFVRTPATHVQQLRSGECGAISTQFRNQLDARVEFDFQQWGKLQMAIAGGAEHINVLAVASGGQPSLPEASRLPPYRCNQVRRQRSCSLLPLMWPASPSATCWQSTLITSNRLGT